jgi:hypothetical protein
MPSEQVSRHYYWRTEAFCAKKGKRAKQEKIREM